MKKQVYICHTVFHLFVSLLKAFSQKDVEHHILIPDFLKFNPERFVGRYLSSVIVYPYTDIEKEWFAYKASHPHKLFSYKKEIQIKVQELFDIDSYDSLFCKSEFVVFNDGSPFVSAMMLRYRANEFVLIEDGEAIYTTIRKDFKHFMKVISGYPLAFGNSSIINRVEVRFPERLSSQVHKKSICLKFDLLMSQLSLHQRNELLDFFETHVDDCDNKSESVLLLTQPLSEDGIVSETYKVALYKKIVSEYANSKTLYIKPHPRELTDYSKLIKNSKVLSRHSPVELLEFASLHFETAITLFSTSIHSVSADYKVYLSLDYDNTVKQSWLKYMGVKEIIK